MRESRIASQCSQFLDCVASLTRLKAQNYAVMNAQAKVTTCLQHAPV
jgi:hypothetical protein